jgi:transportin-3
MATNGAQQGFEPVLAAHNMMQSSGNRAQKEQAHQFLEQFQKSVCWTGRGVCSQG